MTDVIVSLAVCVSHKDYLSSCRRSLSGKSCNRSRELEKRATSWIIMPFLDEEAEYVQPYPEPRVSATALSRILYESTIRLEARCEKSHVRFWNECVSWWVKVHWKRLISCSNTESM